MDRARLASDHPEVRCVAFCRHCSALIHTHSMMGYSTTAKPDEVRCYGFKSSADDLAALLDEAKVDGPLVVVGHDWVRGRLCILRDAHGHMQGGLVAWRFAGELRHILRE